MSDDIDQNTILSNLTNAHNALNDTVNKHIEFTSTLDATWRTNDEYNDMLRRKMELDIVDITARYEELKWRTKAVLITCVINTISIAVLVLERML